MVDGWFEKVKSHFQNFFSFTLFQKTTTNQNLPIMARTKQTNKVQFTPHNKQRAGKTTRAVKEPMKPRIKKQNKENVPLQKNGGKRLKERLIAKQKEADADSKEDEQQQQHHRIMRKGAGRRGVVREANASVGNIISKTRFRRMIKSVCSKLGTESFEIPPLFDGSKPFKGFKNGLTPRKPVTGRGRPARSGNLVVDANEKLLRIHFGEHTLDLLQQVSENEMAQIVEHTLHARVEQMSDTQREKAQGTNIRLRPQQVEGALFRFYKEKDPLTLTYFRYFASLLGKNCSVSPSRFA